MKRFLSPIALLALAVGAFGVAHAPASAQNTATPPPSPPPLTTPTAQPAAPAPEASPVAPPGDAQPTPSSSAGVKLTPKGTPSPPPEAAQDPHRVGISGVWEVQIQRDSETQYTHFKLDQTQSALTGQYLDSNGKKYPLAGSVDGKQVHIVVSMPDGNTVTFTANVDGAADMLGMMQSPKENVAFTASYRPKYKWIDNISPNPGLGTGGGLGP